MPAESDAAHAQDNLSVDGLGAGRVAGGAAAGGAPAPAGLPCRHSNNCTKQPSRYRLRETRDVDDGCGNRSRWGEPVKVDSCSRVWHEWPDGLLESFDGPSPAEAKAAFQLRKNIEAFVQHYGRDHCAFWTLTDCEGITPKQFARRWHSFMTHEGSWVSDYIRVLEPQRNQRPHYHLLTATPWDMRPDAFDWLAFHEAEKERNGNGNTPRFRELRRRYVESAAPEVRAIWRRLRRVLPRYGLGRSEFLPIRKGAAALCEYVGKYLEKGFRYRRHEWKGTRRVEISRRHSVEWKRCSRVFTWVSPGARAWRARVGQLAEACGIADFDGLRRRLGSRWAYRMRGAILTSCDEEFAMVLASLAKL